MINGPENTKEATEKASIKDILTATTMRDLNA